jgi:hypothetical protein
MFVGANLVSWSSKRQPVISHYNVEARYRIVGLWPTALPRPPGSDSFFRSSRTPLERSTLVDCENVRVVYRSTNPMQHQRMKHMQIDLHFIHELVVVGDVRVFRVPTTLQFADIFNKGSPSSVFTEFRSNLNVCT